jgi:beta-aspartyl-peptidase (threonine type)
MKRPAVRKSDWGQPGTKKTLALFKGLYRLRSTGLETVGAVAVDQQGTVAAGASTGGIAIMVPGRVGDTPLIGCGVYADNEAGAVSMTGIGESIIRLAVAKEIIDRLAYGASPSKATQVVLEKLVKRIHGSAGALVLSGSGRLAIQHVTRRMAAGYWNGVGRPVVSDCFR